MVRGAMDKRLIRLLEQLKSSSYRDVYKAVEELRALLRPTDKSQHLAKKLLKQGITKILLRLLKKKYSKLLPCTLSVLGTCCLLDSDTRVMLQNKGLPQVLFDLQSALKDDDAIQNHIFRCVGSLAILPSASKDFHGSNFVRILVDAIKNKESSVETIQMAIRALRLLGDTAEHRAIMLQAGTVKVIADQLASTNNDVLKASLKTLTPFCGYREGASQIQKAMDGQGFLRLVVLAKIGPQAEKALLCLCLLAHQTYFLPFLVKDGAVEVLFAEIKEDSETSPLTVLNALCLFCKEIICRARIRDNDLIPDLISLYTCPKYFHLQDILLKILLEFIHDDMTLKVMVDNNLVPALMFILRQYIRSINPVKHNNATSENAFEADRRRSVDIEGEAEKSPSWPLHLGSPQSSPSRTCVAPGSPSGSSMCLSPPHSPQFSRSSICWSPAYSPCSEQMDCIYSPVCDDSSSSSSSEDEYESLLASDSDKGILSEVIKKDEKGRGYMVYLFTVLEKLSLRDWALYHLMTANSLKTLLAYVVVGRVYVLRAELILNQIISCFRFLLPMVHQRSAQLIYTKLILHRHERTCNVCNEHEKIGNKLLAAAVKASGPYGFGELAYILQKGSTDEIYNAVLAIPFIITSKDQLRTLLLCHSGLQKLLSLITNDEESSSAILSVCRLAESLEFTYSDANQAAPSPKLLFPDYQPHPIEAENKVTFLLDDDSLVDADKNSLVQTSDVFQSMLFGGFKESSENVVKIQDISKDTLVLLLLHCNSYAGKKEVIVGKPDVVSVLDLIIVADKYLLKDMISKLVAFIKYNYFNAEDFSRLFKWCDEKTQKHTVDEVVNLYEDACSFLLVGPIQHKKRIEIFGHLIRSGMWEYLESNIFASFSNKIRVLSR